MTHRRGLGGYRQRVNSADIPISGSVRSRLVCAADRLFYAEGIHAVGIDRVLAEAGVAKASLYHHFSGKDELVVAYLDARSDTMSNSLGELLADVAGDARARLGVIFEQVWGRAGSQEFRGCPFINAAAEYPMLDHPVRAAVTRHRQRFAAIIDEQLQRGGVEAPPVLVQALAMAYDGCTVAAQIDPPGVAERAAVRALDALLSH